MYYDEDIKAIIKAAMQEFNETTRIATKQSAQENQLEFTGSDITSEAMDNLLDLQSINEIDINDTPDMVILESRHGQGIYDHDNPPKHSSWEDQLYQRW